MTLDQYLTSISTTYKDGIATEFFEGKIPNLTEETINQIAHKTGLHFILAKDPEGTVCMANNKEVRPEFRQTFTPTDILDYAYAILHSSNFPAEKKILKTNFPYPKNAEIFWKLAKLGSQIKQNHLLENLKTEDSITYQQKITLALSETNLLTKKIDKIILE
ncbi:MAG TPA: type ISP restriction/modification enzyme [Flavobacterium sp.]|nr:type ISP restriction/modification enzyme [Flavobacterium sp.]